MLHVHNGFSKNPGEKCSQVCPWLSTEYWGGFFFLLLSASDYRLKQMKVEILNRILQWEVFFNRWLLDWR